MNAKKGLRASHAIQKAGRKLGFREALERTNRKFSKALGKLAQ